MKIYDMNEFLNESKKITESRLNDVLDKFKNKIDHNEIYKFSLEDPSKQNLYLQWMIEQKLKGNKDIDILSAVKAYVAKKLKPEDINKCQDIKDVSKVVGHHIRFN